MYNKTRTLSIPVCPEVAAFAVLMETKLQSEGFDEIASWEGIPLARLFSQLQAKAKRLAESDPSNTHGLFLKAVVIGNLAMMIAEKAANAHSTSTTSEPVEAKSNVLSFPAGGRGFTTTPEESPPAEDDTASTPQRGKKLQGPRPLGVVR